jgi:glycosyltransferase involved in cell wall biosynthesis
VGSLRQIVASFGFPLVRDFFFSHAWVTGPYQYEFARKIGFNKRNIIFNCYSADVALFNSAYYASKEIKKSKYPHRFLFAGRYEKEKGIDILINAWRKIGDKKKDWELHFIGNGSLESYLKQQKDIAVMSFMQPDQLIEEIRNYGCFVLPSRFEPWALVLHEFSAAGLPIICSDVCGAAPVFVTPKVNGYVFRSDDVNALENKMMKIINSSDQELIVMSENAHQSGQKITPETSAANFLSILNS